MGESVTEGSIVEWRVKPGAWIEAGATLVDVTTDKVDIEVPAPASGLVRAILAEEGATVAVGAPLVEIDTSAERPPEGATPATSPQASADGASRAAARNGAPRWPGIASGAAHRRARKPRPLEDRGLGTRRLDPPRGCRARRRDAGS